MDSSQKPTVEQAVCADLVGLIRKLQTERGDFDARYQDIAAKYYHAQATYTRSQQQYEACQQQYEACKKVVRAKQEVIQVLLPHYPHPLTPELRAKIALTVA